MGGGVVFRMPLMSTMESDPLNTPASISKRLNYRFGDSFINSESERHELVIQCHAVKTADKLVRNV